MEPAPAVPRKFLVYFLGGVLCKVPNSSLYCTIPPTRIASLPRPEQSPERKTVRPNKPFFLEGSKFGLRGSQPRVIFAVRNSPLWWAISKVFRAPNPGTLRFPVSLAERGPSQLKSYPKGATHTHTHVLLHIHMCSHMYKLVCIYIYIHAHSLYVDTENTIHIYIVYSLYIYIYTHYITYLHIEHCI